MPSSVICAIRYEPQTQRLTVIFVSGRVYLYEGVPAEAAADFRQAASKGTFFNTRIRDHYRYREVTPRRA